MDTDTLRPGFILTGHHEYTITKTLNRGGFGITYHAEAEFMDHNIPQTGQYAIKEFFPEGICRRAADQSVEPLPDKKGSFAESYDEFKAEADCLYGLHHKGIVPVNEVIEANGTVYYVMKFLPGQSLEEHVAARGGHLGEAEAIALVSQVADALGYLHSQSILHLDVKPDNIMLAGGQPVLIDFGSFRKFKSSGQLETRKTGRCVSDGFSPLEQYHGINTFTPQADVYALAATLFYLLSGQVPVEAELMSKKWVYQNTPEEVSEETTEVLANALSKAADDRTPTVSQLVTALHGKPVGSERKKKGGTRRISDADDTPNAGWAKKGTIGAALAALVIGAALLLRPTSAPTADAPGGAGAADATDSTAALDATATPATTTATPATATATPSTAAPEGTATVSTETPAPIPAQATTATPAATANTPAPSTTAAPATVAAPSGTAATAAQPTPTPPSGTLNLGYAVWSGGIKSGQPDGRGTMTFKNSHVIEPWDIDKRTASPGDRVEGTYSEGHLVYGRWHKTSGETEKLNIGKR